MASKYQEEIPPIRNEVSIVGDALTWNPTDSVVEQDGTFNLAPPSGQPDLPILRNITIIQKLQPF